MQNPSISRADIVAQTLAEYPEMMTAKQVLEVLPFPTSTFYRSVKVGRFPQPVKLTTRNCLWHKAEVFAFMTGAWKPEQVEA